MCISGLISHLIRDKESRAVMWTKYNYCILTRGNETYSYANCQAVFLAPEYSLGQCQMVLPRKLSSSSTEEIRMTLSHGKCFIVCSHEHCEKLKKERVAMAEDWSRNGSCWIMEALADGSAFCLRPGVVTSEWDYYEGWQSSNKEQKNTYCVPNVLNMYTH